MSSETECFHLHSYSVETINVFDQYIGFQETFLRTSYFMNFTSLFLKNGTFFCPAHFCTAHLSTVSTAYSLKEHTRS